MDSTRYAQQEGNQQSAQPSIPIQEWVNGLELNVHQGRLYQNRQVFVLAMKELFERTHALLDLLRWGRNKRCVSGPRAHNPVLGLAEFARALLAAASFGQENLVNLANQTKTQRKIFAQSAKSVIHRCHVI